MIFSNYQQNIFSFVETGTGNGIVRAAAGAGKTSTIIALVSRMPLWMQSKTLLLAYNAHIRDELKERAPSGVAVLTNHQLGMRALTGHLGPIKDFKSWINKWKYQDLCQIYWNSVLNADHRKSSALEATLDLVRFTRLSLTNPCDREAVLALASRYGVEIKPSDEETVLTAIPVILSWGKEGLPGAIGAGVNKSYHPSKMIDFDDMLWLPHQLPVSFPEYQWVIADECQDLSRAQLETALRAVAPTGRTLFVGDPNQAIYAFAGADAHAYQEIEIRTQATQLPLTVCYRCARAVVERAAQLTPGIEPAPDAPEGVVEDISEAGAMQMVQPGDVILCRINAPLVGAAFELLRRGIPAKVLGRDIGERVTRTLDAIEVQEGYTFERFHEFAEKFRTNRIEALSRRSDSEDMIISLCDHVDTVREVYSWCKVRGATSAADLRLQVASLFSDDASPVTLSSIHKSKGLEWNRVFLLKPHLLPHPLARTVEAQRQEINLSYVATTRAKRELYLAHDPAAPVQKDLVV